MLKELAEISRRMRKFIRARELAATHTLEKMRRGQMLEQRATSIREISFDKIETIAEMHT